MHNSILNTTIMARSRDRRGFERPDNVMGGKISVGEASRIPRLWVTLHPETFLITLGDIMSE